VSFLKVEKRCCFKDVVEEWLQVSGLENENGVPE